MSIAESIWSLRKGAGTWKRKAGGACIVLAAFLFAAAFGPLLWHEARYRLAGKQEQMVLTPAEAAEGTAQGIVALDTDFGIIIPKIGANSRVIADTDWQNATLYQAALRQGVAHAAGTAKPGEAGTAFLFAHSGLDFYEAVRYNAEFSLLGKLEPGDGITVFYRGDKHAYQVEGSAVVEAEAVEALAGEPGREQLHLMTCWPPGTTWKRLIVTASPIR